MRERSKNGKRIIKMRKFISKLPKKYQWSIHNIIAHPVSEVFHLLGLDLLSQKVHDMTLPEEE